MGWPQEYILIPGAQCVSGNFNDMTYSLTSQAQEAEADGDMYTRRSFAQKSLNLNISAIALYIIIVLSVVIIIVSHFVVFVHVNPINHN